MGEKGLHKIWKQKYGRCQEECGYSGNNKVGTPTKQKDWVNNREGIHIVIRHNFQEKWILTEWVLLNLLIFTHSWSSFMTW